MEKNGIERRVFFKEAAAVVAGLMIAGTARAADENAEEKKKDKKPWTPLFNGTDLTGWTPEGGAVWTVENGCLVGKQGPGNAPGDLFTNETYGDFKVRVTYKIQWPANSGIWFRYQSPEKSYQADILEFKEPECYSGTIYCPGKMFLSMNTDKSLVKKDDWNTMVITAKGDHLIVRLNGKVVGDVHEASFATGKIGFQIHPGDEFKDMMITVKEVAMQQM